MQSAWRHWLESANLSAIKSHPMPSDRRILHTFSIALYSWYWLRLYGHAGISLARYSVATKMYSNLYRSWYPYHAFSWWVILSSQSIPVVSSSTFYLCIRYIIFGCLIDVPGNWFNTILVGGCRNSIFGVFLLFLAKNSPKSSRFSESRLDTRPLFCFLGPDFVGLAGQPNKIWTSGPEVQIFLFIVWRHFSMS